MSRSDLLSTIDSEIHRLQQARALLAGSSTSGAGKKSANRVGRAKRTLSAEGRKRIAEAQRKRWAAKKNAANSSSWAGGTAEVQTNGKTNNTTPS